MLSFENTKVFNFDGAIRGMRNPMDSWGKSDSHFSDIENSKFIIGNNDLELARKLIKAGSEHRKFLRQIMICTDITAPRFWWTEFDTYKIGTVANSCSTMHKIASYPFSLKMFTIEKDLEELDVEYWNYVAKYLELLRLSYATTKDSLQKTVILRKIKEALPEGFLQKRTVTLNYENIYTMSTQREYHRMLEWSQDFIDWVNKLPYVYEFFKEIN